MKIYQGEAVSFMFRVIEGDELSKYDIRATLTPDGSTMWNRDCTCCCAPLHWDNIPIVEDMGVWEISPKQSETLHEGKYLLEIALYNKSDGKPVKMQIKEVVEVVCSYTATPHKCN